MATISFAGLGSGMDYSTWIEALVEAKSSPITTFQNKITTIEAKQNDLNSIKTSCNTLKATLTDLNYAKLGGDLDVFSSHAVSSSNSEYVTADVSNFADIQNVSVFVEQLATQTMAQNTADATKKIDGSTVFTNLTSRGATAGSFSVYVDNEKVKIDIEKEDTLDDIKNKLEESGKLTVNIEDGKFKISADGNISIGSNSDTSNFSSVMNLTSSGQNSVESTSPVYAATLRSSIIGANSGFEGNITAGTFTIGDEEFTIDENTTITSLINKINSSNKANVVASFDFNTGKLKLKSKLDGATNINIEAGTSNFTDVMGFTENGKIASDSQTLGQNAKLIVNGNSVTSFSNNVTSEVTGLTGVTLNLKKAMTEDVEDATISVTQDTDKIMSALKDFISNINNVIDKIDMATSEDGNLMYESQLVNLKTNLKSLALSALKTSSGTMSLSQFGISSGDIGISVDEDTSKLVLDEDALRQALNENPEQLKELLVGDGKSNGVVTNLLDTMSAALNTETGFFATKNNTYSNQISIYKDKIEKKQEYLDTYRASLEAKFKAMDETISKLQSQYSNALSLLGSSSSS